jgi:hypothetical protein
VVLTPGHWRGCAIVAYAVGVTAAFDGPALLLALGVGMAAAALTAPVTAGELVPRFRIEYRHPSRVRVLAATSRAAAGRDAVHVLAEAFVAEGASGRIVLVDGADGRVIAWRILDPRATAPLPELSPHPRAPR